jgi:hypothetical protein
MESAKGTSRDIDITSLVSCEACNGSGSKDGKVTKCGSCGGRGMNSRQVVSASCVMNDLPCNYISLMHHLQLSCSMDSLLQSVYAALVRAQEKASGTHAGENARIGL